MLRHHLILAYRNYRKFKSSFIINLLGLSSGLACTMLIYLWVDDELKMNGFHKNDERLFQVMAHQHYSNEIMTTSSTPGLLAEALKEEIPDIEFAATTTWINTQTLSYGDLNQKAEGYFVGRDYFSIFSYELIHGEPSQVLQDKNSIVISESLARNIFGKDADAIGKQVEWQHQKTFMVTGVFKDIPHSSSYQFDFVLPFDAFKDDNEWVLNWQNNGPSTFVSLRKHAISQDVSAKITDFIKTKHEETHIKLFLQKYSERYLHGSYENGVLSGGRIEYVHLFSIIALFILTIACINFMNLSTARASRRAKEVGIKKAVGAPKMALITQFITEAFAMSLASMLLACIIVFLFLPEFNQITDKEIVIDPTPGMIISILIIIVVTGFVSGSYPALYLSGFRPVKVLKGEIRGSVGELWARRGLVIFQFSLSILLIISVIVVYKQVEFVQNKHLGYDKENIFYFPIEGRIEKHLETFISELKQLPGVLNASSSGHNFLGQQNNTYGVEWDNKDPYDKILFENVRINYDMIETIGVQLKEGRTFSKQFSNDTSKVVFNEAAIAVMDMEDPVGKTVKLWGEKDVEIIGVVENFHFQSLHEEVNPLFFILIPEQTWNVMVRIESGRTKEALSHVQKFYESFNPGFAFTYEFIDQRYAQQYAAEQRVSVLSRYFAGIAILISCLGLFGLAAFTAERRIKEIGIRKVLGSSVGNIVYLLTSDFTKMVFYSILIAIPIAYFSIRNWLDKFAYRIDLDMWFFIGAGICALVIAWLTVSYQAIRAAFINPAECLRDE